MTEITPGALVTVRQTGSVRYVVKQPLPDHLGELTRWRVTSKKTDKSGRVRYQNRDVGAGDITVVRGADAYRIGDTVRFGGLDHVVLENRIDSVQLGVPAHALPTRGKGLIYIPGTNVREVSKADLALVMMGGKKQKKEK